MRNRPSDGVTCVRDGRRLENHDAAALADETERTLHPRWVRKYFHFSPVDTVDPPRCR